MKLYNSEVVNGLIEKYERASGWFEIVDDRTVLLDFNVAILGGKDLRYCVIKDVFLNSWSSAYSIKFYNKLPKIYKKLLDNPIIDNK